MSIYVYNLTYTGHTSHLHHLKSNLNPEILEIRGLVKLMLLTNCDIPYF